MSLIEKTWGIVDQFTEEPKYVTINEAKAKDLAVHVKEHLALAEEFFIGKPRCIEKMENEWDKERCCEDYEIIAYELLLDSANYNYWYGKGTVRPNGASSYEMSKLLDDAFLTGHVLSSIGTPNTCNLAANSFKNALTVNRYPNLENRIRHIDEVKGLLSRNNNFIPLLLDKIKIGEEDAEFTIEYLIKECPGFASDIFLKRAFLFIIEMNRRMGWFEKDIAKIPIPADYQIPKMLQYNWVLEYSDELAYKVGNQELIQSGSLMECEIRASAMKACKIIAEEAGVTMADVDTYLFANRKSCDQPFHLTITTDY